MSSFNFLFESNFDSYFTSIQTFKVYTRIPKKPPPPQEYVKITSRQNSTRTYCTSGNKNTRQLRTKIRTMSSSKHQRFHVSLDMAFCADRIITKVIISHLNYQYKTQIKQKEIDLIIVRQPFLPHHKFSSLRMPKYKTCQSKKTHHKLAATSNTIRTPLCTNNY